MKFDFGDRRTYAVEPPNELLSRLQAFLPALEASNHELFRKAEEDPDSIDIENVGQDEAHYVEMNLGLGVFEDRSKAASGSGPEDDDMVTSSDSSSQPDSESDSDSSDCSSDDSDLIISSSSPDPRPIKPLPRRGLTHPGITVLGDGISS